MAPTRIELLRKNLLLKPQDPFVRYALGVELMNSGELDEAEKAFAETVQLFPHYVPVYLQYGMVLQKLERNEAAQQILEVGIKKAQEAGDRHTVSELQGALASL